jgi:hypothetical protein
MPMYFVSVDKFRGFNRDQVQEYFTEYGINHARMDGFTDQDGTTKDGWFLEEASANWLMICSYQLNGGPIKHRRTPINDVVELLNVFDVAGADVKAHNAWTLPDTESTMGLHNLYTSSVMEPGQVTYTYLNGKPIQDMALFRYGDRYPINILVNTQIRAGADCRDVPSTKTVTLPERMFNLYVPYRMKGFEPTPGATHNIEHSGVTVAQIFDKTVVFLFPFICGVYNNDTRGNIDQIMQALQSEVWSLVLKKFNTDAEFSWETIRSYKQSGLKRQEQHLQNEIRGLETNIKDYGRSLKESIRSHTEKNQMINAIKIGGESMVTEEMSKQCYEQLKSTAHVKSIMFGKNFTFRVETDTLYCYNPRAKTTHEIGAFLVKVDPNAALERSIIWTNKTRKDPRAGHPAPHVHPDGHACLGNMTEALPSVMGSLDIVVITQLAIQFIESVNIDDPFGQHLEYFPVVNKDKVIVDARGKDVCNHMTNTYFKIMPAGSMCVLEDENWAPGMPIPSGVKLDRCLEVLHMGKSVAQIKKTLSEPTDNRTATRAA